MALYCCMYPYFYTDRMIDIVSLFVLWKEHGLLSSFVPLFLVWVFFPRVSTCSFYYLMGLNRVARKQFWISILFGQEQANKHFRNRGAFQRNLTQGKKEHQTYLPACRETLHCSH